MSVTTISADWAIYSNSGPYWAYNSPWNKGSLVNGVDFTQSITVDTSNFPNGTIINWSWPQTINWSDYAYPCIIFGSDWGGYTPPGTSGEPAPTQLGNFANLSATYNVTLSGVTGIIDDVMFDLWLTPLPNGSGGDEVIFGIYEGAINTATPTYTYNDAGFSANIYVTVHSDGSKVIQVEPSTPMWSGTLSISDFIKFLVWNGVEPANKYLSGAYFGVEPKSGSGTLAINTFSYQWNGNPTTTGTVGNDIFNITNIGGNHVVGNGGSDTVVYSGTYSAYQIEHSGSELLVQLNGNISSLDVLEGIGFVNFSNGTYNVANSTFTPAVSVAAPVIASFSPDSNIVGDGITNARTLVLNGTAVANSTVHVLDGTTQLGTAVVNANGAWSFTTGTLADGTHSFTATDTNASGTSPASSILNVTVDTLAPTPVITSFSDNSNGTVTLSGTSEPNSALSIYDGANTTPLGMVTTAANGTWSFTSGVLTGTNHSFRARAVDVAGNAGSTLGGIHYGGHQIYDPLTVSSGTVGGIADLAHGSQHAHANHLLHNTQQLASWEINHTSTLGGGAIGTLSSAGAITGNGGFNYNPSTDLLLQSGQPLAIPLLHDTMIVNNGLFG